MTVTGRTVNTVICPNMSKNELSPIEIRLMAVPDAVMVRNQDYLVSDYLAQNGAQFTTNYAFIF